PEPPARPERAAARATNFSCGDLGKDGYVSVCMIGMIRMRHEGHDISFPRSAWERASRRSASFVVRGRSPFAVPRPLNERAGARSAKCRLALAGNRGTMADSTPEKTYVTSQNGYTSS